MRSFTARSQGDRLLNRVEEVHRRAFSVHLAYPAVEISCRSDGIVANELMTNSVKRAFANTETGRIDVSVSDAVTVAYA